MAKNYIQAGETITWTNGTGSAVASGAPVRVGLLQMGVALVDIANVDAGSVALQGIFQFAKNTSQAVGEGSPVWWDAANAKVINAPAINAFFLGYAVKAELAATAVVNVALCEFSEEGPRLLTLAATGAQTLNVGDFAGGELTLLCPNTAAQTVNIPSVATIPANAKLFVKKTSADVQAVTLDPYGSETIAGGATFATIDAANDLALFQSTGVAWQLLHSTIA